MTDPRTRLLSGIEWHTEEAAFYQSVLGQNHTPMYRAIIQSRMEGHQLIGAIYRDALRKYDEDNNRRAAA